MSLYEIVMKNNLIQLLGIMLDAAIRNDKSKLDSLDCRFQRELETNFPLESSGNSFERSVYDTIYQSCYYSIHEPGNREQHISDAFRNFVTLNRLVV